MAVGTECADIFWCVVLVVAIAVGGRRVGKGVQEGSHNVRNDPSGADGRVSGLQIQTRVAVHASRNHASIASLGNRWNDRKLASV